jgi:hypothetical protein
MIGRPGFNFHPFGVQKKSESETKSVTTKFREPEVRAN